MIVELDGEHHFEEEQKIYDEKRTKYFETLEFKVIRFRNVDVLFDTDSVLKRIEQKFR